MKLTVKWSNWTFGIWWDNKQLHAWGIDLGPLEVIFNTRAPKLYLKPQPMDNFIQEVYIKELKYALSEPSPLFINPRKLSKKEMDKFVEGFNSNSVHFTLKPKESTEEDK